MSRGFVFSHRGGTVEDELTVVVDATAVAGRNVPAHRGFAVQHHRAQAEDPSAFSRGVVADGRVPQHRNKSFDPSGRGRRFVVAYSRVVEPDLQGFDPADAARRGVARYGRVVE